MLEILESIRKMISLVFALKTIASSAQKLFNIRIDQADVDAFFRGHRFLGSKKHTKDRESSRETL